MQSCCPAEEERLRCRGRTFEDPEEFRHADQVSSLVSNQTVLDPPLGDKEELEVTQQQHHEEKHFLIEKANSATPKEETAASDGEKNTTEYTGYAESGMGQTRVFSEQGSSQDAINSLQACTLPGGVSMSFLHIQDHDNATQAEPQNDAQLKPLNSEEIGTEGEEFRPTAAMSARTVVRERRQWALRRLRRQEGPNEANQLELGGGPPEAREARNTVAISRDAENKNQGVNTATKGGGSIVALLVS